MQDGLTGRYYDGKTAAARSVLVRIEAETVVIAGDGMKVASWPLARVASDIAHGEIRLTSPDDPDARLVLSDAAKTALSTLAPALVDGKAARRRFLALTAGLVGVSAAVVGLVFGVVPMAAEPLTRATPLAVEATIGDNVAAQVGVALRPCEGPNAEAAQLALAPLVQQLTDAAESPFPITLTIVEMSAPNALALPGGHVMVTHGLLETLDHPDAVAAVIAHEIGHVRARDGMVALYRNAGLGVLLEIITGGSGVAQQIVLLGGQLTEARYSRVQEARADEAALQIMADAGYNPGALADAFRGLQGWIEAKEAERKANKAPDLDLPEWFHSHPDLESRIVRAEKERIPGRPPTLSPLAWESVRSACVGS